MSDSVVPIAAPAKRGSYFARHWRGELSLPRSWWLSGVLLSGFCFQLVMTVLAAVALNIEKNSAALAWGIAAVYIALQLTVYIWWLGGTWRSAGNYKGATVWKVLARIGMVLGVLVAAMAIRQTLATVVQVTQAPQNYTVVPGSVSQ